MVAEVHADTLAYNVVPMLGTLGENGYTGHCSYEGLTVQTSEYPTVEEVLSDLAKKLQKKGFTELRTRVNFREDRYLAEREPWVYYKAS